MPLRIYNNAAKFIVSLKQIIRKASSAHHKSFFFLKSRKCTYKTTQRVENFRPAFSPDPTECPWVSEDEDNHILRKMTSRQLRLKYPHVKITRLFTVPFFHFIAVVAGGENNRGTVPIYTVTSLFSFCVFRD